jgi:hypothetical protein
MVETTQKTAENRGENSNVAPNVPPKVTGNRGRKPPPPRPIKWDWAKIEKLILAGHTNREILEMPEFQGMSYAYLKNKSAKFGLHQKAQDVAIIAAGQVERSLADRRSKGIEDHHIFTFEQLEKMRRAIKEHKVTGKVQDLRSMMTLFQQYIDAAEKSYGLNGKDMDERAISLNAMVSLHVVPPQRDEPRNVTIEVATSEVQAITAISAEGEREGIEQGAESGGSDPVPAAEG